MCFSFFLTVDLEKNRTHVSSPIQALIRLRRLVKPKCWRNARRHKGVMTMISLMSMCPPRCYFASLDHIIIYIYIYLYSILYRFAARTKCSRRCAENGMESYSASCCMNVHAIASGQDKIRQRKAESKRSNPSVWERVTLTPKATVMFWDSLHSEYVKSGVDHLARALREEDFSWLSGYSFKRSSHKCRGRSTNN